MSYRRLLLTGAGGFVGRHLATALRARYPRAAAVGMARCPPALPGWDARAVDITEPAGVEQVIADCAPDLVIHLAALASVAIANTGPASCIETNLGGTLALARAVARHVPKATVLFASSGDVYGRSFLAGPADENTPPEPVGAYARSKLAAEWVLADMLPSTARLIVVRAFSHSGPGQTENYVLPAFVAQVARIEAGLAPARLEVGNLAAARDFIDVRDAVNAYLVLLAVAPSLPYRTLFNLASGTAVPLSQIVDRLQAISRKPFAVVVDPARLRPNDIPSAVGTHSRLTAATGWLPRHSLDDLLAELLADWRQRVAAGVSCQPTALPPDAPGRPC